MKYRFHSPLPPEEIPQFMAEEVEHRRLSDGVLSECHVRWKGSRFAVFRRETESRKRKFGLRRSGYTWADQEGVGAGIGWQAGGGAIWSRQYDAPFCGEVFTDELGGSVLQGRFCPHPGCLALELLVSAVCLGFALYPRFQWPERLAAAVIAARWLYGAFHVRESQEILKRLREVFEEEEA